MDLETKRLRGRLRNRWQDEVRKEGRIVGGRRGYITERNVQRMEGNRITKRVLYMDLETKRLRGRPRNR
jgi:hypothetical protein